jgi:putative ABC transport system substrate-binding protein
MPASHCRWRRAGGIGWLLVLNDRGLGQKYVAAFAAAMREKGWVLGEHYTIDERFSGGDTRRFPALAAELVALAPDVLIAVETTARAYRQHTTTIPIVLFASLDPVEAGLVRSLAKPGTNVTGISNVADALTAKNVEAIFEIVPRARRIALLYDPGWSAADRSLKVAREVVRAKGAELDAHPITTDAQSVRTAFRHFERQRPDGLLIFANGATYAQAGPILTEVRAMRLPAAGLIEAGGLARHAPDLSANLRESADFVDRIFRGARAADLPVRQVMSVAVTVNARLAREIGVELPASLRIRADQTID